MGNQLALRIQAVLRSQHRDQGCAPSRSTRRARLRRLERMFFSQRTRHVMKQEEQPANQDRDYLPIYLAAQRGPL
jgi:hypothetical protein